MFIGGGGNSIYGATFSQSVNKTDEDVITLPIQLYAPALVDTTITLTPGGTARPSTEDYGTGKNYTLSATSCSILAGATTPATPVTLTVYNNPLYSLDKIASIGFSDSHGYPLSYAVANITIVDDARGSAKLINALSPGHSLAACVADGSTNNLAAINAIIDYLHVNGGGILYFPAGTYISENGVSTWGTGAGTKYQVTFAGDGDSTILKRINNAAVPTGRLISSQSNAWTSASDSPSLVFSDMIVDGNKANNDPSGADQGHSVFIMGGYSNIGRTKVIADKVKFNNAVADGFACYCNVNSKAYLCDGINPGRSTYTILGGYTLFDYRNLNGYDFEIELGGGAGGGGTDSYTIIGSVINAAGYSLGSVDCGVGGIDGENSQVTLTGLICINPFYNFTAGNGNTAGKDTLIINGGSYKASGGSRIVWPGATTFTGTTITLDKSAGVGYGYACQNIQWSLGNTEPTGQRLEYNTCIFDATGFAPTDVTWGTSLGTQLRDPDYDNLLTIDGCTFTANLYNGVHGTTKAIVKNSTFNNTNYGIDLSTYQTQKFDITIQNNTFNCPTMLYFYWVYPGSYMRFVNQSIAQANNQIWSATNWTEANLTITGHRSIVGESGQNPTTMSPRPHGLVGDTFTADGTTWRCTVRGFYEIGTGEHAATWVTP